MIENIATGNISCGGYVGPVITVKAVVGYTLSVVDPSYVGGVEWRVRVSGVSDEYVSIEFKRADGCKRFGRANPLRRVAR